MDSLQSVAPLENAVVAEPDNQKSDIFIENSGFVSKATEVNGKEVVMSDSESFVGVLEVYIHQARDIHNVCIYHKQDVYAKLSLTSDPENAVSTQIINGGGKNPVFNQHLRLNVRSVACSVKCELWMLSRVKNYLEDQSLGFALVPLSEILVGNGKLEKEFSLSSTDLFHSPAGFVQLSLSYSGASLEVMSIPAQPTALATDAAVHDSEISESATSDFEKLEFPDPNMANENQMMISEYFGIPCSDMDNQSSKNLISSDAENQNSLEMGVRVVESFSTASIDPIKIPKINSPVSSVSTIEFPSPVAPTSSQSSETQEATNSPNREHISAPKEKNVDVGDGECYSSGGVPNETLANPIMTVKVEQEQGVVQQDIVDMYMKSMQQFTESLAKMTLPMDNKSVQTSSENSSNDQKIQASTNSGSRVFYGSRAFF